MGIAMIVVLLIFAYEIRKERLALHESNERKRKMAMEVFDKYIEDMHNGY